MFETIESSEKKSREADESGESTMPMWVPVVGAICDAVFLLGFLMNPDLGHMSPFMALLLLLAPVVGIVGVVGIFKGGKMRAVIAALTGLFPWALILLLPLLLFAKSGSIIGANERAAVNSIRSISQAEIMYQSNYPSNGYACRLSNLGGLPESGAPSAAQAQILPPDLAAGQKAGYAFQINCAKGSQNAVSRNISYEIVAVPLEVSRTGKRGFCADENGVITFDPNGGTNCTQTLK